MHPLDPYARFPSALSASPSRTVLSCAVRLGLIHLGLISLGTRLGGGVGGSFGEGWCPVDRSVIPKSKDAKSLITNTSVEPVQGGPVKCVGGNVGGIWISFEKLVSMRLVGSYFAIKWKNTLSVSDKF